MKKLLCLFLLCCLSAPAQKQNFPGNTRSITFNLGTDNGSALVTGDIQPQKSIAPIDSAATVIQVVVLADAGASTVQVGYRSNGATTAISPVLTPATVSGITDKVACANVGGTAITIQGNSVTCSALTNTALAAAVWLETVGGAADATTKRLSVAVSITAN